MREQTQDTTSLACSSVSSQSKLPDLASYSLVMVRLAMFNSQKKHVPFWIHVHAKLVRRERQLYGGGTTPSKSPGVTEVQIDSLNQSNKDVVTEFKGAPFNVKTLRFRSTGLHPKLTMDSDMKSISVSPCSYQHLNLASKTINHKELYSDPSWKVKNFHRDLVLTVKQKQDKAAHGKCVQKLGPGAYFGGGEGQGKTHDSPKLPRIGGGQLKREPAGKQMPVPGPGMYSHHDNTKLPAYRYNGPSLFESSLGHQVIHTAADSGLPPATYTDRNDISNIVNRQTGKLGPYQIFTTSRWGAVCQGSPSITKYQTSRDTVQPLLSSEQRGPNFTRRSRYYLKKLVMKSFKRSKNKHKHRTPKAVIDETPGPGTYDIAMNCIRPCDEDPRVHQYAAGKVKGISAMSRAKANLWLEKYGFMSTTKKKDKITSQMWKIGQNKVGPGRYDVMRYDRLVQDKGWNSGHRSAFVSRRPQHYLPTRFITPVSLLEKNSQILERNNARLNKLITQQPDHSGCRKKV